MNMNYKVFDSFQEGYHHTKEGMGCEDYSLSFSDAEKGFYIGVICDGISDKKCFRSASGAKFGCESALEILKVFLKKHSKDEAKDSAFSEESITLMKKGIRKLWEEKISEDLKNNPFSEDELKGLDTADKTYMKQGKTFCVSTAQLLPRSRYAKNFLSLLT